MDKKISVNEEKCIGCALCTTICPDVFKMQSNGKAQAVNQKGDSEENIKKALDSCPVSAIQRQ